VAEKIISDAKKLVSKAEKTFSVLQKCVFMAKLIFSAMKRIASMKENNGIVPEKIFS